MVQVSVMQVRLGCCLAAAEDAGPGIFCQAAISPQSDG